MPDRRRRGLPLPQDLSAQIESRLATHGNALTVRAAADMPGAAELLLYGEIGWDVTALAVRQALATVGRGAPVIARINSGGGYVIEGFAIYNALAQHAGPVTVAIDAIAASMAAFIAMAGDTIIMPTNSFMMIHNPSGIVIGESADMRAMAELLDKLRAPQVATFSARTGQTPEAITAMLDAETWMSADEASRMGFADEVLTTPSQVTAWLDAASLEALHAPAALVARASATPRAPRAGHYVAARTVNPSPTESQHMDPTLQGGPATPAPATTTTAAAIPAPGAQAAPAVPVHATFAEIKAIAARAKLGTDWIVATFEAGMTEAQAMAHALDTVAAAAPAAIVSRPPATEIIAERDKKFAAMANALAHRANPGRVQLDPAAREFRGMRLADLAAECLRDAGVNTRGCTPMEIAEMAMGNPSRMFRGAGSHTTSDFPNLLANTASKSLRLAYEEAPRTFVPWCAQHNLPDFKDFKEIALGGVPNLESIAEDGEVHFGTIGEAAETWHLVRYGKAIAISYVAIVNDDLRGFSRLPAMFGSAAARLESDIVYGILLANAALSDTVALFHATHNNLLTGSGTTLTADATGIANVGNLAGKLGRQVAPSSSTSVLNLRGAFILVPPSLEPAARALWSPNLTPTSPSAVNPYASSYQPISEGRLEVGANGSAGSATAFYLMASPDQIDTIHYGYLEGEAGPRITQEIEFDTDGMSMKVMHNFGAKAIDYRGMTKSAGA